MTEISREQYRKAVDAFVKAREVGEFSPQSTVEIVVHALGLRVYATPEERITAFVAKVRAFGESRSGDPLWKAICYHFPEVLEP